MSMAQTGCGIYFPHQLHLPFSSKIMMKRIITAIVVGTILNGIEALVLLMCLGGYRKNVVNHASEGFKRNWKAQT